MLDLIKLLAASFFLIGCVDSSHSAENSSKFRSISIMGPRTCASWLKNENSEKLAANQLNGWIAAANDRSWATGVISGLNAASPIEYDALENINAELLFDWIHKYCTKNPQGTVFNGIEELFQNLKRLSKKK